MRTTYCFGSGNVVIDKANFIENAPLNSRKYVNIKIDCLKETGIDWDELKGFYLPNYKFNFALIKFLPYRIVFSIAYVFEVTYTQFEPGKVEEHSCDETRKSLIIPMGQFINPILKHKFNI